MAYDLRFTFPTTWAAHGNNEILLKYPFVCDNTTLRQVINDSGIAGDTSRNPNGYTAIEIADKVCKYWDIIMNATWNSYFPLGLWEDRYFRRWDQEAYWLAKETSFIFHDGNSSGFLADILNAIDIVLLPGTIFQIPNAAEYRNAPFMGFDYTMLKSQFAVEMDQDGSGKVNGIKVGGLQIEHFFGGISGIHPSLMYIYSDNYYHSYVSPNGYLADYWWTTLPSNWQYVDSDKWNQLRIAKFEVTVSGGSVTAITPVSRLDGNGVSVTGGWGYETWQSWNRLDIGIDYNTGTYDTYPVCYYKVENDQVGYTGYKAEVDINDIRSEFYAGSGMIDGTYDAWAIFDNPPGRAGYTPGAQFEYYKPNWYDRNWPTEPRVQNVRISIDRPVLISTTRSLKAVRVGTGAQRYTFEFEYPPLNEDEFRDLLDAYEVNKGASNKLQIWVPSEAMEHSEHMYYQAGLQNVSRICDVVAGGTKGSQWVTVDGWAPGTKPPHSFYFRFQGHHKIYRAIDFTWSDPYGRLGMKIEPPLLKDVPDYDIYFNTDQEKRRDFFAFPGYIVEDSFEYTVDAAGYYRVSVKFVEANGDE